MKRGGEKVDCCTTEASESGEIGGRVSSSKKRNERANAQWKSRKVAPGYITSSNERNRMTSQTGIDKGGKTEKTKRDSSSGEARRRDHPSGIKLAAGEMFARP